MTEHPPLVLRSLRYLKWGLAKECAPSCLHQLTLSCVRIKGSILSDGDAQLTSSVGTGGGMNTRQCVCSNSALKWNHFITPVEANITQGTELYPKQPFPQPLLVCA